MQSDLKSAGYGRHFLRRSDAAAYITERYGFPCSRQWLAKLAVIGGGPVGMHSAIFAAGTFGARHAMQ